MSDQSLEPVPAKSLTFQERRDLLNFREKLAFDAIVAHPTRQRENLNPSLIAGMYELFISGKTLEDIVKINQGSVTLGEAARLRVEDRWDERKVSYRQQLEFEARERLKQTQLEGIDFLAIQLKATTKFLNAKLLKYIATGDDQYYKDASIISSMKDWSNAAEMLLKLSGQDKESNVNVSGQIQHEVKNPSTEAQAAALKKSGLSSKQAAGVLAALIADDEPKDPPK
jgi:hypothetical protein